MHTKQKSTQPIDWFNTTFMGLFTALAVVGVILHLAIEGFNPWLLIPFFVLYIFTGISITAGYHRLFSHRTYKANSLVKLFYLIFGAAAFENSCLKWSMDHRRHHTYCDEDQDPYNINEGFWYAHMGWILTEDKHPTLSQKFARDLENDPLVMWQQKYYIPIAITAGILLPGLIGFMMGSPIGGFAVAGFFRIVFVHHMTFFINSLCHVVGTQPYTDTNSAKDSWLMALFTYGEGYHNFHHYFQSDYRNGVRWFDFDPSKWTIQLLSKIGMAWGLKTTAEEEIINARILMDQKRLSKKSLDARQQATIENLLDKIHNAIAKLKQIKKDANAMTAQGKENVELAKLHLKDLFLEWNQMKKSLLPV